MTALSFPASPTNGQVYDTFIYDSSKGVWERTEWAMVSGGTQSSYTLADGTSWVAHTFTSSGTLTVSKPGLLDCMVVGTGGGAQERYGRWGLGGGGAVRWGVNQLTETGSYAVTVGSPSGILSPTSVPVYRSGAGESGRSFEGAFNASKSGPGGGGAPRGVSEDSGTQTGGGQGGTLYGLYEYSGITLNYSGSNYEYGGGGVNNSEVRYGKGTGVNYVGNGGGIVIVRYQV